MPSIEAKIERAVAVLVIRSTASVVPSPTRFPNATEAPASGGSTRRSNSALSASRRRRRDEATRSKSDFESVNVVTVAIVGGRAGCSPLPA